MVLRLLAFLAAIFVLSGALSAQSFEHTVRSEAKPWKGENFASDADDLTFVLHADLTGGERKGVFAVAAQQMALLGPEFVISVGDLIEGGGAREELIAEWEDFDVRAAQIGVPVFYVGGNHDLSSEAERAVWAERHGPPYYHFLYKNVLFLVLDTEDMTAERRDTIASERAKAVQIYKDEGPEAFAKTPYALSTERVTGAISKAQSDYFVDVISKHQDARHVIVITHKPAWEAEETEFHRIEAALAAFPYTVFNGHEHFYDHRERLGRDYIQVATTSGEQFPDLGFSEDHVTLVTVSGSDVTIANLMMRGIRDKYGKIPLDGEDLCFAKARCEQSE